MYVPLTSFCMSKMVKTGLEKVPDILYLVVIEKSVGFVVLCTLLFHEICVTSGLDVAVPITVMFVISSIQTRETDGSP